MKKKLLSSGLVMGAILVMNGCGGGSSNSGDNPGGGALSQSQQIALSQTTLGELRTQALSIVDYNDSGEPGYLDTEALNIGTVLESCSLDAQNVSEMLIQYMETDTNVTNENWDDGSTFSRTCTIQNDTEECTYEHKKDDQIYTGTFKYPKDSNDINMSNFEELYLEFHGTVPTREYSATQTYDLNVTMIKTDMGADITLNNISLENTNTKVGISGLSISTFYQNEIDENNAYFKLNSITLNGQCSNYTAIGTLSTTDYVQNATLLEGSNENWLPSKLSFEGNLTNTTTHGRISGVVNVELKNATTITQDGDPEVNVNVDGTLAVPERPEMNLALTYNNAVATEATYHHFTANYSYDAITINTIGVMDKEGDNGKITIAANNGIAFKIVVSGGDLVEGNTDTAEGSIVTYNGTLIGTLEYREAVVVVKYLDGSFESLP